MTTENTASAQANDSIGVLRRNLEAGAGAAMPRNIDVTPLIDTDGGLIDRSIYTDSEVYAQEMRRIFARSWLFLAHETQFKKPGDFFTTFMGEDPVIVSMDKEKKIRVYLNSCRHRGVRLCRADAGATKMFTCTYHGWSFDLAGALQNVPNETAYPDTFKKEDWSLIEVPRVESYRGLIFGNWDKNADSPRTRSPTSTRRWSTTTTTTTSSVNASAMTPLKGR